MIDYTNRVSRIGIINKVWYNYYINDYSISNNTKKEKLINDINNFINEIEKRMNNESDINLQKAYQQRIDKSLKNIDKMKNIDKR